MAQAKCDSITRRAIITRSAAAVPAAFVPTSILATSITSADPAFAAIAAHRAGYAALDQACRLVSDLEGDIPEERREEWLREDREAGIGADDDPRWTAANAAYWAASAAEEHAAWALAHCQPAGLAGAAALLRYAAEYEQSGCEWPSDPENESGDEEWMPAFHVSLAAALDALA